MTPSATCDCRERPKQLLLIRPGQFQDGPFTGSQAEAIDDGLAAHDSFQDGKSDNAATQKENVDLADNTLSPQEELRLRSMLHSTNDQDQSTGAPDGSEILSGIVDFEVAKPGQVDEQVPNHTASQYEDDTNPSHINSIIDGHRRKLSYTASPRGIMPFSNGDSNEDSNGRERAASPTRLSSSLKKTVDTGADTLQGDYYDLTTHIRPAVVEEHIRPHVHTIYEPRHTRSLHFHEHRTWIQPIIDPEPRILPDQHWLWDHRTGQLLRISQDVGQRLMSSVNCYDTTKVARSDEH